MTQTTLPTHIQELLAPFASLSDSSKIEKIITMGRALPTLDKALYTPERLVPGCQSKLYIEVTLDAKGLLVIQAASDALISQGLAALFIKAYEGQTIRFLFETPPQFFSEIGLFSMISIQRQQGFLSLYKQVLARCAKLV